MLMVAEPILGEQEKAALAEVIDSGWITMGDRVRAFECAFAEQHNASDAVAVNSCTAALHLILEAARATRAATGPPWRASGDHGPRARSVGTMRPASGTNRAPTPVSANSAGGAGI